jgi:hypothetical protein
VRTKLPEAAVHDRQLGDPLRTIATGGFVAVGLCRVNFQRLGPLDSCSPI